jgi:DNA polymerase-3 subunit epsilon
MDLPTAATTLTDTPPTSFNASRKFSNGENESPLTTMISTTTMKPTASQLTDYKESAKQWAIERLADENTVIIDIESTGLLHQDPETEIVQICILNIHGRPLFSMLLKPSQPMRDEVIAIHKITNEQIINQPIFPQIAKMIAFVLKDKHVVSWNMDFDWRLLVHMFKKYDLEKPEVAGLSCEMDRYSEWAGEWSAKKDGFKWQKLPNFTGSASHDAFNDCENALKAMQKMAGVFNEELLSAEDIDLDF